MAKYGAMLAKHEHKAGEVVLKLNAAGRFATQTVGIHKVLGNRFGINAVNAFETNKNFYTVKLANAADTAAFLEEANKNPAVAYAEPNYIFRAYGFRDKGDQADEVTPNDPSFNQLWGMKNVGQNDSSGSAGVAGADIGAAKAWAMAKGNKKIVVAVIDTGVDYTHPDLKDNIFRNEAECGPGDNNVDDDGNGFIDDCRGWNFAGVSTKDPMDDNEHGTHVSGTIGARGNDGVGVVGVNWETSILPVKFLSGEGSGTLDDAIKAIQYATKMGAHVMNNSWGGGGYTQSMKDAIEEAKSKGLLFIAAAGNDGDDSDSYPHYPASYEVDNVIAVAATTNRDALASFSTYGKRTVHIAAPGHRILSSVPHNGYDSFSGTSMATPHVAGAAALVWGANTGLTYAEVKDRLLRSRDPIPSLARKTVVGGRLNVYNALIGHYPPSNEPDENAWASIDLDAPIASEHPYKDGANNTWTIEGPADAKFIRVVIAKMDSEANYDFVKIFDAAGTEIDSFSGKVENGKSWYANGNKLTIKFSSDSSINGWGFEIQKYQVIR